VGYISAHKRTQTHTDTKIRRPFGEEIGNVYTHRRRRRYSRRQRCNDLATFLGCAAPNAAAIGRRRHPAAAAAAAVAVAYYNSTV